MCQAGQELLGADGRSSSHPKGAAWGLPSAHPGRQDLQLCRDPPALVWDPNHWPTQSRTEPVAFWPKGRNTLKQVILNWLFLYYIC